MARAWTDPEYKQRLLEDGTHAIKELGYVGLEGSKIIVIENTDNVHNMVSSPVAAATPGRW